MSHLLLAATLSRWRFCSPHSADEETEARRGKKAGPGSHRWTQSQICARLLSTAAHSFRGERTVRPLCPCSVLPGTWAVGLPGPGALLVQGRPRGLPGGPRPPQVQAGGFPEADGGSQPCDWQLGSEHRPKKSLASFAHKAPILSHSRGHRHPQARAAKGWTMRQTQARAKSWGFFPNAKPRSFSTHVPLAYELKCYRKGRDFLCQRLGGRWLGEVPVKMTL